MCCCIVLQAHAYLALRKAGLDPMTAASQTVPPLDAVVRAAVAQRPRSTVAAQPADDDPREDAAQPGPGAALPGPLAVPGSAPQHAGDPQPTDGPATMLTAARPAVAEEPRRRRRSDPGRGSQDSRSRRVSSSRQPGELRKDPSRRQQSPGADRSRDVARREQSPERRQDDRKRLRSRSRSPDSRQGRRSSDGGRGRGEGSRRRNDDSPDWHVWSGSRSDHSGQRGGSERSGSRAFARGEPVGRAMPGQLKNEASLLATASAQVQHKGQQRPSPHAIAVSEDNDVSEAPPLPDSQPGLQALLAQVEGKSAGAITPETLAAAAVQKLRAVQMLTTAAEVVGAQPPPPSDAAAAAEDPQPDAPAAVAEPLINDLSGMGAPLACAGTADGDEADVPAHPSQPADTDGDGPPPEPDGARRRRRRDAAISADGENDDGQAKRQRLVSRPQNRASRGGITLLQAGFNPWQMRADVGPAWQSYKTSMCRLGDLCPQQSDCGGAHAESELLSVEEVSTLCDLASDWRKYGVPLAWQHLKQLAGNGPGARESQSPPPLPPSAEPRSPSEPPPPLPADGVSDGAPSSGHRLPPPSNVYMERRHQRDQEHGSPPPPPLPSDSPASSPSPRPPPEVDGQPRYSPVYRPSVYSGAWLSHRPASPNCSRRLPPYEPTSPPHSHSYRFSPPLWPQSGQHARSPAQPDSSPYSVGSPSYGRHAREETPPYLTPYPPPPELRDMPPLGSAQEARDAAQAHLWSQAEPTVHTAERGEGDYGRPSWLYRATEEAHGLLASGIDPRQRHRHPDYSFNLSIRTRLCEHGAACNRHEFCAFAHSDEELLTRDDNVLLVEVAREWELHGVPDWWIRFFEALPAAREDPPARTTTAAAQARRQDVDAVAPEDGHCQSVDDGMTAPPAQQPDPQQHAERLPAEQQDLPPSMRNEDLEMEASLMKVVQVRVLYSRFACSRSASCCTGAHVDIYPSTYQPEGELASSILRGRPRLALPGCYA